MRIEHALAAIALCAFAMVLGACADDRGADVASIETPSVAVYSLRGEVDDVPGPDQPTGWIAIHHEAIPDFVGITGDPEPMHSMTMRFPVAEGVDLSSLAPGDKVAFDLEIDWNAGDPARVLAVTSLPAETELDFGSGDAEHADH